MTPMRVSTTTLESFRLFMDGDWMDERELIETIKGEFSPNYKVALGQSYHAIVEKPEKYRVEGGDGYVREAKYVSDAGGWRNATFRFAARAIEPMLELVDRRGLFEVKQVKAVDDCVVVSKCDHILGTTISELKGTTGRFDPEKYMGSCQWRFMAWMFEASSVIYRVACLDDRDEQETIGLRSIENLSVYPYPAMESDCRHLLKQFVDYCRVRKLDGLLIERQKKIDERSGKNANQLALGL